MPIISLCIILPCLISSIIFVVNSWNTNEKSDDKENNELNKFTNIFIDKVSKNIDEFRYNVIIANFYEMYNFFSKVIQKPLDKNILVNSCF